MFFKCHRRNATERGVAPRRVVERLDIIEDGKFSLSSGRWFEYVQLGVALEGAPERFHDRIVVAVAGSAHAAIDSVGREQLHVLVIYILAAAVGVMQQS